MPNYVTNKVVIIGTTPRITEIVEFLKSEDGTQSIDFNKIAPMPSELHNVSSPVQIVSEEEHIKQVDELKKILANPPQGYYPHTTRGITQKMSNELKSKYGSDNWYDWSCKNWGTKWNTCSTSEPKINAKGTRATYFFQTAWATPSPIFEKLSEKFPDVKIKVWFADEDMGYNVGRYGFEGGEVTEDESLDGTSSGRSLAQRLNGGY
jgi:hypothetical protein